MIRIITISICVVLLSSCGGEPKEVSDDTSTSKVSFATTGNVERVDAAIDQILPMGAAMEILADGFDWSEGPVWIADHDMLLFSDIPPNAIYRWTQTEGATLFLQPSGYTGLIERSGEPGSNGLLLDQEGHLILCQHGDRRIARYTGSLEDPKPAYETIVDNYQGMRLNSPNDATFSPTGLLYFTDPPYGLEGNVEDPAKEIPFQGVYRVSRNGEVELLIDTLTRPNGIAFSPDGTVLYVANSDPDKALWMAYDLDAGGSITDGRVFFDVTNWVGKEPGLPDGLKVHRDGTIFATGPGGVWIFSPSGKVLGKLKTGRATANCAFDDTYSNLYITADNYLLRLRLSS
jgi:gluconolactonase